MLLLTRILFCGRSCTKPSKIPQVGRRIAIKYPMLTDYHPYLLKISVQQEIIKQDGWQHPMHKAIELKLIEEANCCCLALFVNGFDTNRRWNLHEQIIPSLTVKYRDEETNQKRTKIYSFGMRFYVVGATDHKRFDHLYYYEVSPSEFKIGTRTELGIRYATRCRTKTRRDKEQRIMRDVFGKKKLPKC